MSDYISRDLAKAYFTPEHPFITPISVNVEALLQTIDNIPAADVAPVVRCKDCKFLAHFTDGHNECRLLADLRPVPCTYLTMKEDDYCSYGERRDADAEE